jgi:RNA polymerase sigma-70 factor (ECF subfamily)
MAVPSFEEVMLPHLDAAYTLARYLLRSEDAAQDAVQDAFLRAVRHFDGYRGDNARAWLLTIVRHCCATARASGKRDDALVEFDERHHSGHAESATPELHLVRSDAAESLRHALGSLSSSHREVLILREIEGLSYEEIARTIGAPVGTVMSRLARARKQMQTLLHREARDAS